MRSANHTVHTTKAQMTKDVSATSKKAASEDRTLRPGPQEKLKDDDYCESNVDSGFLSGSLSLNSCEFDSEIVKDASLSSCFIKSEGQREVECCEEADSGEVPEAFEPDQDGDTHLHLAIIQGLLEVVVHIINLAPLSEYLNCRNDLYQTPLYLAVITHQPKIVRRLVAAGADVNARDRDGNTALHHACSLGDMECVKQLTVPLCAAEIGSSRVFQDLTQSLDLKNYDGFTCMHLASISGKTDIVHHLAMYGAGVNTMDGKSGWTPLHYSVHALNYEMTKFLLEKCKADPKVQNYTSRTPLSMLLSLNSCKYIDKNTYRKASAMKDMLLRYDSTTAASSDEESDSDVKNKAFGSSSHSYSDLEINGKRVYHKKLAK